MRFAQLAFGFAAVLAVASVNASVLNIRAVEPACPTECPTGTYCGTTTCHPIKAAGEACSSNRACGPVALCLNNKTCSAANPTDLPVGEKCSSSDQCADQGLCQKARCIANPAPKSVAAGGACRVSDQCANGYCNRAICKNFVAPGGKCTLDQACEGSGVCPRHGSNVKPKKSSSHPVVPGAAYSADGICPQLPYSNNPVPFRCAASSQCETSAYCHKQNCASKLPLGELCDSNRACQSHNCARPPVSASQRAEKICMARIKN